MARRKTTTLTIATVLCCTTFGLAQDQRVEISEDGQITIAVQPSETDGSVILRGRGVPYGSTPDWQNNLRVQVGGLQAADMNGDGLTDLVVGCYHSQSYPPYPDWENLIYYNAGGHLENTPSWVSADEYSTTDIQIGDINKDTYPDIFAANGDYSMSASVIYWGSPTGPSTSPGWFSNEPGQAWTIGSILFDFDHDNDLDLVTANQGNSPSDPYRPMFAFFNNSGVLATTPGWQSAETSIQNFLDFADYDNDGWEDLAVSKWVNFQSGIYRNVGGTLQTIPAWTTGDTDSDKGVAWADIDDNGWVDFILGHDPTTLYSNDHTLLTLSWTGSAPYYGHSDLRVCDVDRDGDPDVAEVHFSDGRTHIYLNEDGTLTSPPAWTYDSSSVGTAIAFGDFNGDEWPDLAIGYSGDPSVVVFYAQMPAIPGDVNCDGTVDFGDINPFVDAMLCSSEPDPPACWNGLHPDCPYSRADVDESGTVDFGDINPFVGLLLP